MAVASKNVVDDTLPKIGLEDQIQFNSFTAIKTWSLFNPKKETELAAAYDKALKQLKDDGFISEKSKRVFLVKIFFRILQIQRNRSGGYRWNFFLQQF